MSRRVTVDRKFNSVGSQNIESNVVNVLQNLQVVEEFEIGDTLNIGGSKDHYVKKTGDNLEIYSKGNLTLTSASGSVSGGDGGSSLSLLEEDTDQKELLPKESQEISLGSDEKKFKNIYAQNIFGEHATLGTESLMFVNSDKSKAIKMSVTNSNGTMSLNIDENDTELQDGEVVVKPGSSATASINGTNPTKPVDIKGYLDKLDETDPAETELNGLVNPAVQNDGVLVTHKNGDVILSTKLWIYTGTVWKKLGDIRGPVGSKGQKGEGSKGDKGLKGESGSGGNGEGSKGEKGQAGTNGDKGQAGTNGDKANLRPPQRSP